jgi:ABC-type arginine transport system permease subunit
MNCTFYVTVAALYMRFCLIADRIVVYANRRVNKKKTKEFGRILPFV